MTKAETSEILSRITTRNEANTHFTQLYSDDDLSQLETDGLIKITRPVHDATGIPYSQEHWSVDVTAEGLDWLDANPSIPRVNEIGKAAIREFLIENCRYYTEHPPTESELEAWITECEQSIANRNGASIELSHVEVVPGGFRECRVPADGYGWELCPEWP